MLKARFDELTRSIKGDKLCPLILILTILHLIPIWSFKYFPSQDGPCHLENSYMLLHYFDSNLIYGRYYELNLDPFPNWFSHLTLASLMILFPPLIAEKILLTGYVLLFVGSILYFLGSVDRRNKSYVLLAFPFIYNYLLHMGFYNFSFSFPLMFLTIGWWFRRRDGLGMRGVLWLNLLLIWLYFCHIVSQLLAIGSILLLAAAHNGLRVRRTALLAASLSPSYVLPIYYIMSRGTARGGRWPIDELLSYFGEIGSLTSYDEREYWIGRALAILFAALLIYTLAHRLGFFGGRPRLKLRDSFLALSAVFTSLYFLMPDAMSGGGFITSRLNLYPFIAILPWFSPDVWRPFKRLLLGAALAIVLVHLGFTAYYYRLLNEGLEEYTAAIDLASENETILPVSFNHGGGDSLRIGLYLHAAGYYCIAKKGVVELDNYEGATGYFPLKYRPEMNPFLIMGCIECMTGDIHPEKYPVPIDYILLWCPKEDFPARRWIEENYELVLSRGRMRFYRRARPAARGSQAAGSAGQSIGGLPNSSP